MPTHLDRLEAESIDILREAVAENERPVLLCSIGKDSSTLLHLARKAFHPSKPPFPLLHVDTAWKFREMIAFRDRTAAELGLELIVHRNPDGAVGLDDQVGVRQLADRYTLSGLSAPILTRSSSCRRGKSGIGVLDGRVRHLAHLHEYRTRSTRE